MPATKPSGIVLHIDGGSRGNPGPAAYAVVVKDAAGHPVTSFSRFLGRATNNVAEYEGLLAALDYALHHHHTKPKVFSDSELLVRQLQGRYKVKSPELKVLYEQARDLIARLEAFSIEHVRREQNREADRLVNQALDAAEVKKGNHQDTKTPGTTDLGSSNNPPKPQNIAESSALPEQRLKEPIPAELDRLAHAVVDAAYKVHSALGPGLLENVYETCLAHELTKRGLLVERQVAVPVEYDGVKMDAGFRIDLLVESSLVVELKSSETFAPVHTAQILTYLKLTRKRLGLLINFNVALIRDGIKRVVL
jgi:GxxExxY protein